MTKGCASCFLVEPARSGRSFGPWRCLTASRSSRPVADALELEDADAISRVIAAGPWSAVINAAAYTQVDRAESEPAVAFAVNAAAPSRLSAETGRRGIPLVHISTDYVFDGKQGRALP